jgi:phosphohistidine phosphatase
VKLVLVRHGIAVDRDEFDGTDADRFLTPSGVRKMGGNAKGLATLVERPDVIITSPLLRAKQTADLLQQEWRQRKAEPIKQILSDRLKPGVSTPHLITWLRDSWVPAANGAIAVLVGHEPDLSLAAGWLLGCEAKGRGSLQLKKGGALLIEFSGEIGKGTGTLQWLVTPKILRALSAD